MDEGKDIIRLSLPFTAGIALAAVLLRSTQPYGLPAYILSSVPLLLLPVSIYFLILRPSGSSTYISILLRYGIVFLLAGLFTGANGFLIHPVPFSGKRAATLLVDRLTVLIDGIPFPDSGTAPLLKALLTGQRGELQRDTVAAFRNSGASHILALSGLHLGVIYTILRNALGVFGNSRRAEISRCAISILLSLIYTVSTGASPSIVRAFLFITLSELGRLSPERQRRPLNIYCSALIIQLTLSPWVITSVGFQLSYLAMLGIYTVFPRLNSWYPEGSSIDERFNPMRKIWTSASLTISCQIFTAPLVWIRFHTFPVHFLLTNLIALPLTEILMTGAVCLLISSSLGFAPPFLVHLVDRLSTLLQTSMHIIASM